MANPSDIGPTPAELAGPGPSDPRGPPLPPPMPLATRVVLGLFLLVAGLFGLFVLVVIAYNGHPVIACAIPVAGGIGVTAFT